MTQYTPGNSNIKCSLKMNLSTTIEYADVRWNFLVIGCNSEGAVSCSIVPVASCTRSERGLRVKLNHGVCGCEVVHNTNFSQNYGVRDVTARINNFPSARKQVSIFFFRERSLKIALVLRPDELAKPLMSIVLSLLLARTRL